MAKKFELIHTDEYILVFANGAKAGDFCLTPQNGVVQVNQTTSILFDKKIIAHKPKGNAPLLEGVDLLPEMENEVEMLIRRFKYFAANSGNDALGAICNESWKLLTDYKLGKQLYTEEDLRGAIWYGYKLGDEYESDEYIQSLNQSKLPKYFVAEKIENNKWVGTYINK